MSPIRLTACAHKYRDPIETMVAHITQPLLIQYNFEPFRGSIINIESQLRTGHFRYVFEVEVSLSAMGKVRERYSLSVVIMWLTRISVALNRMINLRFTSEPSTFSATGRSNLLDRTGMTSAIKATPAQQHSSWLPRGQGEILKVPLCYLHPLGHRL